MLVNIRMKVRTLLMLWKRVIKAENIHKIPLLTRIKVNLKGFTADQYPYMLGLLSYRKVCV
jgi:hypothetical protein